MNNLDSFVSRWLVGMVTALAPAIAFAQAAPPAGEAPIAPAPDAPVAAPVEPAPLPPPVAEVPPAPAPEPAPVAPQPFVEPPPLPAAPPVPEEAKKEEDVFKVTTGAGIRAAIRLQGTEPGEADELNDIWVDELNLELRFGGKVTKVVSWTGNLTISGRTSDTLALARDDMGGVTGIGGGPIKFQAQALDVIAQLDFMDEFHVWLGRMLTPSDRSNFSGPWFISPWNYPGVFFGGGPYVGPRGTEEVGREVGAVVWGNDKSGKFKYYAGVMDLDNPELTPLFTGRLGVAIIGDEPGFYGSSTYYGTKDILALGVAGQYQKRSMLDNAATAADEGDEELTEFNADLLAEFNIGDAGTLSGEVGYYHMDGPVFPVQDMIFGVASYITPNEIGIGKLQPLFRIQKTFEPDLAAYEGALSYVMKDYFAKLTLVYTHTDLGNDNTNNMVQLGFQVQQ